MLADGEVDGLGDALVEAVNVTLVVGEKVGEEVGLGVALPVLVELPLLLWDALALTVGVGEGVMEGEVEGDGDGEGGVYRHARTVTSATWEDTLLTPPPSWFMRIMMPEVNPLNCGHNRSARGGGGETSLKAASTNAVFTECAAFACAKNPNNMQPDSKATDTLYRTATISTTTSDGEVWTTEDKRTLLGAYIRTEVLV